MQRVALINWTNKNQDYDLVKIFSSIATSWVVEWLEVQSGKVTSGHAFVDVVRDGITFPVLFTNTQDVIIDTTWDKKVFVEITQDNIDNGSINSSDGSGIWEIKTDSSYPLNNFIKLASIYSWAITDERSFINLKDEKLNNFNWPEQLVKLWEDGKIINTLLDIGSLITVKLIAKWNITKKDKLWFHTTELLQRTSLWKWVLIKTIPSTSSEYIWFAKDNYSEWEIVELMWFDEYYKDIIDGINLEKNNHWPITQSLDILSWETVTLDITQKYFFTSINIQSWWKLNATWEWDLAYIYCEWDCTINWEIDFASFQIKQNLNSSFTGYIGSLRYSWNWWNWAWWKPRDYCSGWLWWNWNDWFWGWWGWWGWYHDIWLNWGNWWFPWWTTNWWLSCWGYWGNWWTWGIAYWNNWQNWGWWAWWIFWKSSINLFLYVWWENLWNGIIKLNWENWGKWGNWSQQPIYGAWVNGAWGWWGWWGWWIGWDFLINFQNNYSIISEWWSWGNWWISHNWWNTWLNWENWSSWKIIEIIKYDIDKDTYNW